jgi:hypothetical protein
VFLGRNLICTLFENSDKLNGCPGALSKTGPANLNDLVGRFRNASEIQKKLLREA